MEFYNERYAFIESNQCYIGISMPHFSLTQQVTRKPQSSMLTMAPKDKEFLSHAKTYFNRSSLP